MAKPKKIAEVSDQCVSCGCCVKVCPKSAIAVYKGMYAVVDDEKCIGCGECANACPAAVISITTMYMEVINDENETKTLV